MNDNIIVDLYLRVSTKEQVDGFSIGAQEESLRKFAEAHGWIINKVLPDGGWSGSNMNRPALQELISDAQNHRINKAVVYKLDRLSRSQKDTLYLIEEVFIKNGVDFVSMTETLDTSTPFGMAMIGILSVFAQLERATITERMMLGRDARVKKGGYNGHANMVIGYDYDSATGVITQNDFDASIVRQIYRDYIGGKSQAQIRKELNQMKWRDHEWNAKAVKNILTQPLYVGRQRWKGEEYIVENCPCILTDEIFEEAQKEMARRSGDKAHTTNHVSLLGGMIWCGRCGRRYAATRCMNKDDVFYRYYCYSTRSKRVGLEDVNCHNRGWREEELNRIVIDAVKRLNVRFDESERIVAERQAEYEAEISAFQNRLRLLEKQNEKLVELFTLGAIDAQTIKRRADAVTEERKSIEAKMEALKKPTGALNMDDVHDKLATFAQIVESANTEEIKLVLHQLIKSITLTDDDVKIIWNFDI